MPVITNDGLDWMVRRGLGIDTLGFVLSLRLFEVDFVLSPSATTASFRECTVPGYAPVALAPSAWTPSGMPGVNRYGYPLVRWQFMPYAGPQKTVYGYFVTESRGSKTLLCDKPTPAYPVPPGGGAVAVVIDLESLNCP